MALSAAKKRLLEHIKRRSARTPAELGQALDTTAVAARQHLQALEGDGYVVARRRAGTGGRGRPAMEWALTERGHALFPDRHGELTVDLLEAAQKAFGADGVERLLAVRADDQIAEYREAFGDEPDLEKRVAALAAARTDEGYMAESVPDPDGEGFLLIEHHCPICEAARACVGLCAQELTVFRRTLGDGARVHRTRHLLAGDARCVYRVEPVDTNADHTPCADSEADVPSPGAAATTNAPTRPADVP